MSKEIVLRRDGVPSCLSGVTKIRTPLAGGSNVGWVPDDETVTTTLKVYENGTYLASDFGYYGFTKVNVLVEGGSGAEIEHDNEDGTTTVEYIKAPTSSAEGASLVLRDPETGVVTYYVILADGTIDSKTVPSYAMVTESPKSDYASPSETVDYAGAEITLYYGDGTVAEDWNGGVLAEGTDAWNSYVRTQDGNIGDIVIGNLVVMHILPWWYADGMSFSEEYQIRAFYSVTIGG